MLGKDGQYQNDRVKQDEASDRSPGLVAVLDGYIQQPVPSSTQRTEIAVIAHVRAPGNGRSPGLGILPGVPVNRGQLLVRLGGKGRRRVAGVWLKLAANPGQALFHTGWLGSAEAAVSEAIKVEPSTGFRTGKDCGIGRFPSHDFTMNSAWLAVALIAAALLSWLRLLALDGDLARAEPKTLRYRVLHAAGKLVRGGRRRRLKIPATWPWADAIATAWARITALPHSP